MAVMVSELFEALRKAGVDEETASKAARAVLLEARTDLATKVDLKELEATLTWRMVLMTGVFVAAVSALRIFS